MNRNYSLKEVKILSILLNLMKIYLVLICSFCKIKDEDNSNFLLLALQSCFVYPTRYLINEKSIQKSNSTVTENVIERRCFFDTSFGVYKCEINGELSANYYYKSIEFFYKKFSTLSGDINLLLRKETLEFTEIYHTNSSGLLSQIERLDKKSSTIINSWDNKGRATAGKVIYGDCKDTQSTWDYNDLDRFVISRDFSSNQNCNIEVKYEYDPIFYMIRKSYQLNDYQYIYDYTYLQSGILCK